MRIAVLGLGFMGATHIKALNSISGTELGAVFDFDPARLKGDLSGVRGNFGGPAGSTDFSGATRYEDFDALLADRSIDAVDVCLPTYLHAAFALRALAAGKHVLVEKPMALNGADADRMVAEAARRSRVLMAAQVLRFRPEYMALRELAAAGRWGSPRYAALCRRCATPGWSGWLRDPTKSGGGAFDLLIHDVDMCLHLFGAPAAVSAAGTVDPAHGIDTLDARLLYANGLAATVSGGWFHPPYPFSMKYTVVFEGATVEFDSASGRPPELLAGGADAEPLAATAADAYLAEIEYFVRCCRENRTPDICPPGESAAAVKLMALLVKSRNRKGEVMECKL
jgi:predicted dehydrogenase